MSIQKVIRLIKNLYSKIKLCVKNSYVDLTSTENNDFLNTLNGKNDVNDMYFSSYTGFFQGESLSPFLFSMFINDLDDYLANDKHCGILLDEIILTSLLFADDMVIFSNTRKGLQNGLDALYEYCVNWGLTVNVQKTNCVAFKGGGNLVLGLYG